MASDSVDAEHMAAALEAARRGWGRTAPNPMVGAVVVRDGVVVGVGWHAAFGGPHAETAALDAAGDQAHGATVYVTLEPCTHTGRTPPCVDALLRARVARVVIAIRDPNPKAGGGVERLRAAGIEVVVGVRAAEACELNAPFLFALGARRPWVTVKLALSRDGAIADATGRSKWITGVAARAYVHRLRAGSDAVAVGIGTAEADDPLLTVRDAESPAVPPARVIFDRRARLPLTSQLVRTARMAPVVVVTAPPAPESRAALEHAGVDVVEAADLEAGLQALRARGYRSLLVEGGALIATALLERALVDRLVIFQAPAVFGEGALRLLADGAMAKLLAAKPPRIVEERVFDEDVMTVYALREIPCSQA